MSKQSQNPNYGRPTNRKIKKRLRAWQRWGELMTLLRDIHREVEPKLAEIRERWKMLDTQVNLS